MRLSYKFRLYPNKTQLRALCANLETHRRLYNDALAEKKSAWENEGKSLNRTVHNKSLRDKRKLDAGAGTVWYPRISAERPRPDHPCGV